MAASTATTVAQYLAELPPERRTVVARVRDVVRANIPAGYQESMGWGMICWSIPLSRYPDTYNKQPLGYVCLAAQKNYFALYLTCLYMDPVGGAEFARAFEATGRKLDMGKSCVRFRTIDDLPLDVVGQAVARTTPEEYIAMYERARAGMAKPAARKAPTTRKAATKKTAKQAATTKGAARKGAARKGAARKGSAKSAKRATAKRP